MSYKVNGELIPTGGGDNIPLVREKLTIGRRETCDVCLKFPNVSGLHAELAWRDGYWFLKDCNSTNGVKVNGTRVQEKILHPRDRVTIGKRDYVIKYDAPATHMGQLEESQEEDILSTSLMERAGLTRGKRYGDSSDD